MQDERRPPKLLGPPGARRQQCPACAAALRAGVHSEHTDPGLAALQKLGVGRGRARDEGDAPQRCFGVSVHGHQDLGLPGATLDVGQLALILAGEVPARYSAISGDDKLPDVLVFLRLHQAHFHTETISGLE
jgi:hypothetical protein